MENPVQEFLDQVRAIVPSKAMRICGVKDNEDYRRPSEFTANKTHKLTIARYGVFTGTPEEILKAVKAKAEKLAALEG